MDNAVEALSEIVIENKPVVAREKSSAPKRESLEMRTPQRNVNRRSPEKNAANKLEVKFMHIYIKNVL